MKKLANKVAVITGGNSGIGLATARLYAQEGATVVVTARNEKRLEESAHLKAEGLHVIQADVTKTEDLINLFSSVEQQFGKIDILFANAGVALFFPIDQFPEDAIDTLANVNFKGLFLTVQKALPHFNESGSIIINTSASNTIGLPNSSVYAATKAAARSFARTLSAELVGRGIRVNAVSPGPITTPIYDKLGLPQEALDGFAQSINEQVPLKRFGTPEELAKTALFLASDDSTYIVGAEIVVDGGMTQL